MSIEELVKRKTELTQYLQAIGMCNMPSKTEELIALNLEEVKARKELYEIEGKIRDYIEGKP